MQIAHLIIKTTDTTLEDSQNLLRSHFQPRPVFTVLVSDLRITLIGETRIAQMSNRMSSRAENPVLRSVEGLSD